MVDSSFEQASRRASLYVAFVMIASAAISLFMRSTWLLSLAGPAVLGVMLVQLGDYARSGSWLPNAFTFARVLVMAWLSRIGAQLTGPSLATAILLVFLMDGLDGFVARTTGTTSGQGAHFDAESDAYVLLSVCVVHALRGLSPWVLAAGLVRYAFAILIDMFELDGALPRTRLGRYASALSLAGLALAFAAEGSLAPLLAAGSTLIVAGAFAPTLYLSARAAWSAQRAIDAAS